MWLFKCLRGGMCAAAAVRSGLMPLGLVSRQVPRAQIGLRSRWHRRCRNSRRGSMGVGPPGTQCQLAMGPVERSASADAVLRVRLPSWRSATLRKWLFRNCSTAGVGSDWVEWHIHAARTTWEWHPRRYERPDGMYQESRQLSRVTAVGRRHGSTTRTAPGSAPSRQDKTSRAPGRHEPQGARSICAQRDCLGGRLGRRTCIFDRVSSLPATDDGSAKPLAKDPDTGSGDSEDISRASSVASWWPAGRCRLTWRTTRWPWR